MKLSKLYSSNPKFKTIKFNTGINIVAGLQSSHLSTDTYNGIGKSSSLQLIHLMLGGKLDPKYACDRVLKDFLSSYGDFFLDLKVGSIPYTIKVNFSDEIYYLNGKKIGKQSTFSKHICSKITPNSPSNLSFKQILNCFARRYLPSRNYYSDALQQQGRPAEDFYQRISNLALLGLDVSLAYKFKKIRDELEQIEKAKSALKKANLTENESELRDLEDKRVRLIKEKNNFIIAKNYDQLKEEADTLTEKMNYIRNKVYSNDREIRKKQKLLSDSKEIQPIDLSKVESIFNEAQFHFPELVNKQLKEAQDFHIRMQHSRRERLKVQVESKTNENNEFNKLLSNLENKRDSILKDLNSKGALEEYNSIVDYIRTLESKIAELTSYQTTVNTIEKEQAELENSKASIKLKAVHYIDEQKSYIKNIENKFRSLVLRFYEHGGALGVQKNPGEAKYLFDIEPYIPKDGSQGVGEVKIFCYDMLLFHLNPKLIGFMAHDSFLFGGVDMRQTRMMFKIALEMCETLGLQYFVNLNKDIYEKLISNENDGVLSKEEKQDIKNGTILELFDDTPANTLFGKYFG